MSSSTRFHLGGAETLLLERPAGARRKRGAEDLQPLRDRKVDLAKLWKTLLAIKGELPNMNQPDGGILTLDEVAAYLKAGKKTVYRLAQQGEIPGFKLGGTWRFRRSELDRWIAAQIAEKTQDKT